MGKPLAHYLLTTLLLTYLLTYYLRVASLQLAQPRGRPHLAVFPLGLAQACRAPLAQAAEPAASQRER